MRFADPSVCPSCAAPIGGKSSCSSCGLDLTTQPARELWQALLNADVLLERARATQSHGDEPVAPLPTAPPVPARAPRRSLSTGTILLALGALFVLVAGFIFITVSWGSLGVTGRALVLLAFTAVVGVLATFVTRRGLRGSAESLWAVFLGLVTLDWFAAWGQGLFGMDSLPFVTVAVAWAVIIFAVASFISSSAQPHVGRVLLVTPMVVAGVGPWVGAVALGVRLFDREDWNPFWSTVVAALFVGAFLLIALRMKHQLTAILLAVAAACGAAGVIGAALAEAFDHPSLHELAAERHGLSLVVVVLVAVGVGIVERRAALGAAIVAMLGVTSLLALPIESAHENRGAFVVISVVIVLAALVLRRPDTWSAGVRVATGLLGLGLGVAALPWVGTFGSLVEESIEAGDGSQELWARPTSIENGAGPWWLAAIVFGALAVTTVLVRWWPEAKAARPILMPAAMLLAAGGVMAGLASGEVPFVVVALVAIAVGAALSEAPPRSNVGWTLVGPVIVALSPVLPLPSRTATLVVWLIASVVLAVITIRSTVEWKRDVIAFFSASWGLGAAGIAVDLADQPVRYVALALVVAAALGLAVVSRLRALPGRRGIEVAAAVVAVVGIAMASVGDVSLGWLAAIWTVLGASVSLVSLFTPDRPYFRWVGFGALGFAYVLRLIASDVEIVEAYTLPFGVVLLGAGLWWMRGNGDVTTVRALGSGLLLCLLPSLPQALDEPTSWRALLLGLAAFAALALGAAKKWKAPFVLGAIILLLVVIVNVGPLAMGLPRWTLIALVGGGLIGAGVTWEDRLRDGRAAATYLVSMR